jgi:hypothetical protein
MTSRCSAILDRCSSHRLGTDSSKAGRAGAHDCRPSRIASTTSGAAASAAASSPLPAEIPAAKPVGLRLQVLESAFNKAQGSTSRGSSALAQVTDAKLAFSNGVETARTIRADRKVEGRDHRPGHGALRRHGPAGPGAERPGSRLRVRLRDRRQPQPRLPLHEVYLALAKTPIEGPGGAEAAFDVRGAHNAAAGRMMTATLSAQQPAAECA